jgi:uncharacterized protein
VAYSGGTDSTFLLKIAHDTLGERALALTADSPSLPRAELADAQAVARHIGARLVIVHTLELDDPRYVANSPQRCYFCKSHLADTLAGYARAQGYATILDGNNADDLGDYRPGQRAARERGVRSPLQEAGLTKAEIRELARAAGLPNWDKPAAACLSSRIPYNTPVTMDALSRIERAEAALHARGFRQVRVRHHGNVARIEVEPADLPQVLAQREAIVADLQGVGYTFVALDLAGFRSGSLNAELKKANDAG